MPVVMAPAEVLAGLIAVCVLLCAVLIANIVRAILNSVNVFGILSPLISAMDWLARNALSAMSWLWAKTNPVAVWIALVNVWHSTENGLLAVIGGDVLNALQRIVSVAIPNAAHWAVAQAQGALNAFIARVDTFYHWTVAQFAAVQAYALSLVNGAMAVLRAEAVALYHTVEADIAAARNLAVALVTQLRNDLVAFVNAVRTEVLGRVITVEQEIAVELPRIEAEIGQIATVAIPALTVAIEAVREAEQLWRKDCGDPLCSNLLDFGKILNTLGKLLDDGILFALVAEAARDPAGTAREVEAILSPIAQTAETVFRDATGVAA